MKLGILLSAMTCVAFGAAALAGNAAPMTANGKWVVEYAEHQCTAALAFGTDKEPLKFIVRPALGGDVLQLALVSKGSQQRAIQRPVTIGLSDGTSLTLSELRYGLEGRAIRLANLDHDAKAKLSKSTAIVWSGGSDHFPLNVGPLVQVLKTLESCRMDLRDYWNIDSEKSKTFARPARSQKSLISYVNGADYPWQALKNEEGGTVGYVLLIDEAGKLRDCMIEKTSNVPTLDIMGCIVFKQRAKFDPALDASGKPVRSAISARIQWVAPE